MRRLLLISTAFTLLAGCSGENQNQTRAINGGNVITFNDFESLQGWIPENNTLTREAAHSGQYSIKVEPGKDFSLGYDIQLGQVTPRKPHKIRMEAWAYLITSQSQAKLGLQITDPATNQLIFGDGIVLAEQVKKYRTWVPVSKEIVLPDSINYSHHMKVFLWRNYHPEAAYVDDVRVSIVE